MNKIQEKCFDILIEIDRVCKAAGLKYYIYAGTLLGAIRHGGFIPWDDDIDIVMMREDYDRFVEACEKYLNSECFELQTIDTDPLANNPWMKLHNKNTAFISNIRRDGAMEGINIDIFPIDNVPDSEKELKKRAKYFDRMNFIYEWRFAYHSPKASVKMRLFQSVISLIPPVNEVKFKKKYDCKIREYNNKNTKNVAYFSNRKYVKKIVDRSVFDDTVMLRFEDRLFPAPSGWNKILERLYGKNYMELPPTDQRVSVHGTAVIDLEQSWRNYRRGINGYEKI
jgi:lipopolysaccharide cholinephosphotransferase